ncbi:MAG: DUF4382 domain-containing protein [Bacteroidota bacterium]
MKSIRIVWLSGIICAGVMLQGCVPGANGPFSLYGTDAPIDDPLYTDVHFTIKDIQINGESIEEFDGPMTLNISQLRNGITTELIDAEVSTGEADDITIVFDLAQDAEGNAPGCYIATSYGRNIDLGNAQGGDLAVRLLKDLEIRENEPLNLVIDFDLRKSIRNSQPGDESELVLVDKADLEKAFRIVREEETGTVSGQLTNQVFNREFVNHFNIYAYRKGTFDKNSEQYDTDGDGIAFENAVTSARVAAFSGATQPFSLHFLEEGEYELAFEAYEVLELSSLAVGMLQPTGQTDLVIPVTVSAGQTAQVAVSGDAVVQ